MILLRPPDLYRLRSLTAHKPIIIAEPHYVTGVYAPLVEAFPAIFDYCFDKLLDIGALVLEGDLSEDFFILSVFMDLHQMVLQISTDFGVLWSTNRQLSFPNRTM